MGWSKVFAFFLAAFISITIGDDSPALTHEKVVRMALKASDIRSLDPHYGTTTIDYACLAPMFNGLVRFKPEDIDPEKIEPDLDRPEFEPPTAIHEAEAEQLPLLQIGQFHITTSRKPL